MKNLILAFILGVILGILGSTLFLRIFPNVSPITREYMPLSAMFQIFIMNSFLATLICYGGIIFSLVELKVYKFSGVYRMIDKTLDPLYFTLEKIFKQYRKLGSLYRTLYFSLSIFSIGCIFLIGFTISFYFWIFFALTDIGMELLVKSSPHLILEISVFIASADAAQKISHTLRKYVVQKKVKKFKKESIKLLKDRKIWWRLSILYIILFFSAIIERFFVSYSFL